MPSGMEGAMNNPHPLYDFEMRVGLFAGLTEFSLPERSWPAALDLAKEFGWEPEGALPPETDGEAWPGDYYEPWEQRMKHSDASRFAEALEKALYRLPDEEDWEYRWPHMPHPYDEWAGKRAKRILRELITFCRKSRSGFAIMGPVRFRREESLELQEEE
jgi:hypothetical protein